MRFKRSRALAPNVAIRTIQQVHDGAFTVDQARLLRTPGTRGVTLKAGLRPLVVETDDAVVLVDTGMPAIPEPVRDLHERLGEPGLTAGLARLGLSTDDVTHVVATHLHYDHVGNLDLFASATFHVQRAELDFAEDPPEDWGIGYCDDQWRDVDWARLDGEQAIVAGVRVVPTPGHTPGHQSVVVDGRDRTVVFPGDAAPLARNLEKDRIPGIAYDEDDARRSLKRLKRWWDDGAEFVFYHGMG